MKSRKKRQPRPPSPSEHEIQCAFEQWWQMFSRIRGIDPRLGFAIPNGGHRHYAVAAKLKAEGVKAGILDWFFAAPRHSFHGLFIEFKADTGTVRPHQLEVVTLLRAQNYNVVVAWTLEEAIKATTVYFSPLSGEIDRHPV